MKLKIIQIKKHTEAKAVVQNTGKLGFGIACNEIMQLKKGELFFIATDEDELNCFYLIKTQEKNHSAKLSQGGNYFYLTCTAVFEKIGIKKHESFSVKKVDHPDYADIFKLDRL